jgi:hypothetical protein
MAGSQQRSGGGEQQTLIFNLHTAGIRLAGATNDVHIFDVRSGRWEKITPLGEPPSPRAAHAAAAVGNMVVIQVRGPTRATTGPSEQATRVPHAFTMAHDNIAGVSRAYGRAALGLRGWPPKTCMSWTSQTQSARAGTGAYF